MEIKNKIAIVTGGSSGLGKACVERLIEKGASVAVWDRQKSEQHISMICDVSDETSVEQALAETKAQLGTPQLLVQCAGILGAARMVGKSGPMALSAFQQVIQVNLIGTFNVMRLVSAAMMAAGSPDATRGVIINTASIAAYEGQIGQMAYSASKGGVVAMTLPAARELAMHHIRVNTIAPGLMETPMLMNMNEAAQARLLQTFVYPERLGKPEEFANLVCHMIENELLNGEVIRLDGAIRLPPK